MKRVATALMAAAVTAASLMWGVGTAQAAATNVVKVYGDEKEVLVFAALRNKAQDASCYWVGTSVSDERFFTIRFSPNAPSSCQGYDGYMVYKFKGQEKKAKVLWGGSSVSCGEMATEAASLGVPQSVIWDYTYPGGKFQYCYPDRG